MKNTFTKLKMPSETVLYIYKGEKSFYFEEGYMVVCAGERHPREVEIPVAEFLKIYKSQFKKDTYEDEAKDNLLQLLEFILD
jgi:hypothetical protein